MNDLAVTDTEPCIGCGQPLPTLPPYAVCHVGPADYDGVTDDGDRVCGDCWCPDCRGYHTTEAARDRCGLPEPDRNDPGFRCDPDLAYAAATDR